MDIFYEPRFWIGLLVGIAICWMVLKGQVELIYREATNLNKSTLDLHYQVQHLLEEMHRKENNRV